MSDYNKGVIKDIKINTDMVIVDPKKDDFSSQYGWLIGSFAGTTALFFMILVLQILGQTRTFILTQPKKTF